MNKSIRQLIRLLMWPAFILLMTITQATAQSLPGNKLTNPLLLSGPDPWIIWKDGYYYYTNTQGNRLSLWKTDKIQNLASVAPVTVWTPPASGPNSSSVWAPELHFLDGKWYMYYTATDEQNKSDATRYVFTLENASSDPTKGTWTDKGKINTEHSGLDGTIFEHRGKRYFVYSAYVGPQSVLAISEMSNPWSLKGKQVIISKPTEYWEKFGGREILEGPEFLAGPKGEIFIVYSASACWADEYSLGMLSANAKANLLDPSAWTKSSEPVFRQSPENNVFAPGHNSFFTSPDGKESWILYHANTGPGQGCDNRRSPRAQKFSWSSNGRPDFGRPVKIDSVLTAPAEKNKKE